MPGEETGNAQDCFSSAAACNGLVLVRDSPDSISRAARLLSWYSADKQMAPREVPCACRKGTGEPDQSCPRCHGSGRLLAMGNPDAKFNSAQRVAAWSAWPVEEFARFVARRCQVIITPDGEWHGRGRLDADGWFERVYYLLSDHAHFAALGYEFAFLPPE